MTENSDRQHKYYSLAGIMPIRVTFNGQNGLRLGAEVPDASTGKLRFENTMLSRLDSSDETSEIDEGTFENLCQKIYSKKNIPKIK
jgi:hypothetical protein